MIDRRNFLGAASLLSVPKILFAQANTDRRFVFIVQRGAADGLNTLVPYADPQYAKLRGALAIDPAVGLKLDGMFALHPSLKQMNDMFQRKEATFFHAVASPYRDRSHFDGQNVLETGGILPYALKDGWMNRLMSVLPRHGKEAVAFSPTIPLALQGSVEVTTFAPSNLPQAKEDLLLRVQQLYASDKQLKPLWESALEARGMAGGKMEAGVGKQDASSLGRVAAGFLTRADGPRVAMIETSGWDTHSGQDERLERQLRGLDGLVSGLRDGMGSTWSQTVVLIATEFGRTVAANGTGGTDHGTAAAAMLLGGAVRGGSVIADWPGLSPANLLDGRDLKPTLALDSLIASICCETFGLELELVRSVLFPGIQNQTVKSQFLRA